jgi:hypothetical protein
MLVTASLLALHVGACPEGNVFALADGKDGLIDPYYCCEDTTMQTCYSGDDLCSVSTPTHQCCVKDNFVGCYSNEGTPRDLCLAMQQGETGALFRWCGPAEDSGLSAGATAGIVVGGILGPFALGLAYKTLT